MMISKEQIDLAADAIYKKFSTKKIFLFGSYANGKASSDSDLDLCVIADLGGKRKIDLIREIRREVSSYFRAPLDILLYDNNEFNKRANLHNTLEYKILKHGVLINGKSANSPGMV